MSKLAQLREQRSAVAKKAHDLNAKYPADQRMPVAEASQLDQLLGEITAIDAEIDREQRLADIAGDNPQHQHDQAMDAAYRARRRPVGESVRCVPCWPAACRR
jgi:hypothetical protein